MFGTVLRDDISCFLEPPRARLGLVVDAVESICEFMDGEVDMLGLTGLDTGCLLLLRTDVLAAGAGLDTGAAEGTTSLLFPFRTMSAHILAGFALTDGISMTGSSLRIPFWS